MKVEIWKLKEEGEEFEGEEPAEILELTPADEIRAETPIRYRLFIQATSGELLAKGSLAMTVSVSCSRCAERLTIPLRETAFEAEYPFENRFAIVDLTPDIRDAMIIAFPIYPVCSSVCKGLCAQCGKNLNRETCRCTARMEDSRWAVLDGLATQKRGRGHGGSEKKKIEK